MPLGKEGFIRLDQIVDGDGNPARVSLIAGVYRLAVDALLVGPAGAYAQGDFDSVAVDEANALAMWVRAAVTGLNSTAAAGSRNVPVQARAVSGYAGVATSLTGLLTGSYLIARRANTLTTMEPVDCDQVNNINGTLTAGGAHALYTAAVVTGINTGTAALSAVEALGAVTAQAYARNRLFVDAILRGDDGATYSAIAVRNADANADFTAALIGMLVNVRNSYFSNSSVDWVRGYADTPANINSEASTLLQWSRSASALFGRDTSDSTMRAIEARAAVAAQAATLYRALVDSANRVYDITDTTWNGLRGDTPANVVNGRDVNQIASAAWVLALDCKYDVAAATPVAIPTSMVRTATGSVVNPAAAATIATLDARGLTNKSFAVTDTAIGTYTIRFSHDGVTYRSPAEFAGIATIVGTVMASNRAIEVMRGYRYIQIGATEAAGTVTVEITAQGA